MSTVYYIEKESGSLVMDTRTESLLGFKDSKRMRVLCILAHPDDEVIFGWPIFQYAKEFDGVALLCCCNNNHKGEGPYKALEEVCIENNIDSMVCLRQPNNFYTTPTRNVIGSTLPKFLHSLVESILISVNEFKPTHIFTHNAMGEYGHGDHRLIFNLVTRELGHYPLLQTDICLWNKCHLSANGDGDIPGIYQKHVYTLKNYLQDIELDEYWYSQMKCIYERHNAWTWGGHQPVRKTRLYCL